GGVSRDDRLSRANREVEWEKKSRAVGSSRRIPLWSAGRSALERLARTGGECMSYPLYIVDAFTDRPFAGNPAPVGLLSEDRPAEWMQRVGQEMNLSETAFVRQIEGGFSLRWFTPMVEVDLCGHATLASSHILWEQKGLKAEEPARFQTRSGWLTATRRGP